MKDFPEFMKNPVNKIDATSQHIPGIEGYVFDGADSSQMAFWTYAHAAQSDAHCHEYDEYIVIIQGRYTLHIEDDNIPLHPGDEYVIPKGVVHGGEVIAGTRAIYAFGGKRALRESERA